MRRLTAIFLLCCITEGETSIYLTDTVDSSSVQLYDCLFHQSIFYCRRPLEPISLQRNSLHWTCHDGIQYSFQFLKQNNTTVSEILHGWKSTLDRLEEFVHYLNHSEEINGTQEYICNCTNEGTFGKYCEYSLPVGVTFEETVATKFIHKTTKLNYEGDLVCYKTLECEFGLLCLDWRDICDGRQQCMFGLDEENCDRIEFNECSEDEYRCMNGMCIPDEYFLDGDFDCLDLSDENEQIENAICPSQSPNFQCDDRICPSCHRRCGSDFCHHQCWSCGDGQCVYISFLSRSSVTSTTSCLNRRDQFFWCETVRDEGLWTLENGRCTEKKIFDEHNTNDYCHYLRICQFSNNIRHNCTCRENNSCSTLFKNSCSLWNVTHYPNGGLLAPFIFGYYNETFRPSLIAAKWKVNGSIKCRGYLAQLLSQTDGNGVLYSSYYPGSLCKSQLNGPEESKKGYDEFCHNSSRTFNNHSYHFIDACPRTNSCISAYRINDGFGNCFSDDEKQPNALVTRSCVNVRNHRFRCSIDQATCLYANMLGDSHSACFNQHDEYWMDTSILISQITCNEQFKTGCSILRQYIEASWNSTSINNDQLNTFWKKIPFRSYCDTYPEFASKDDENSSLCKTFWRCLSGQWQCSSGHCVPLTSMFNLIFDCPDGSDEHNIFASDIHPFNDKYSWVNMFDVVDKFQKIYPWHNLWSICHLTGESPCSQENNSSFLSSNEYCINVTMLNNENITCPPQCDERSIIDHCYLSLQTLGYRLQCLSMKTCVDLSHRFHHHCTNTSHRKLPCQMNDKDGNPLPSNRIQCWKRGGGISERCNNQRGCPNDEDEYMCDKLDRFVSSSERKSKFDFQTTEKQLHLLRYPFSAITAEYQSSMLTNPSNSPSSQQNDSIFNRCNRGIGIRLKNDSIVCFCSPHYHGDQCQYHTDRISLIFHINYTHSKYTINTDPSIVNKYLVLFLQDDLVLSTNEFHLRPTNEFDHLTKTRLYFHYSHSNESIEQKRQRYFNRSNIIHSHPFSIRIEAFELRLNIKPRRFAVWEYPIYFDFLPVYRFVKILHFLDSTEKSMNLCRNNSCHPNEECYQLQNQPSRYKCLCRTQYSGPLCTQLNQLCVKNYCSSNALCQPEYRGLTQGNQWPYCICPLDFIGQRCLLKPSVCENNPCRNNGTCYQESRPDQFICICTEEFLGERCEKRKRLIHFYLEDKTRGFHHQASVIQYFRLDLIQLELHLMNQDVYSVFPTHLKYFHNEKTNPEIVLLRIHSLDEEQIYLLAVQLNRTQLIANLSIDQNNQCQHIQSFISSNQSQSKSFLSNINIDLFLSSLGLSVAQYHSLCYSKSRHLLCFHDDYYLCICNENDLGVECFLHQHEDYRCDECRSNGKCLKGTRKELVCICPLCHSGNRCQFNLESFSFTLDQLFLNDLQSPSSTIKYLTIILLIFIPVILFLVGLLNNLCCFVTFRQKKCRHNGIGEYLLYMSIINQLSLTFLLSRFLHLATNIIHSHSFLPFNTIFCKLINYSLLTSTHLTYWFSSLIAVERLYVVVVLNGRWLKNPRIACRICFVIVMMILFLSAYELAFIQSAISGDNSEMTVCVMVFPVDIPSWKYAHNAIVVMNSLVPFFVNLICMIGIICIATKKKMNANAGAAPVSMIKMRTVIDRQTSTIQQTSDNSTCPEVVIVSDQTYRPSARMTCRLIITVLMENKELVIAPAFTLIPQLFSLPFFLASLILKCQNFHDNNLRYLLIVSYFAKYIPQLTSFLLYISPSSFYFKQWQCSTISSWMKNFRQTPPLVTLTSTTNYVDEKIK
ncbi:unnamed protein product [Rotaria magnacalcarata]